MARSAGRRWRFVAAAVAVGMVVGVVPGVSPVAVAVVGGVGEPPEVVGWRSVPVEGVPVRAGAPREMVSDVVGAPVWPVAGSAVVAPGGVGAPAGAGSGRPGGLPVVVGAARVDEGGDPVVGGVLGGELVVPLSVRVSVVGRDVAVGLGVSGVVLSLVRADGSASVGRVALAVDYSGFGRGFGGDFGARLRLVSLPACALVTPEVGRCRVQRPVVGVVNAAGVVSVPAVVVAGDPLAVGVVGSEPAVYAVTSGASSAAGDFRATSLSPAYGWSAGGQGGEFALSYPIEVPAVPGGLVPEVRLGYSSGVVDGKTHSTNNQPSWVGEGWDLDFGYVERSLRSCRLDGQGIDDLCAFDMGNLSMVFGGRSSRLVEGSDGGWRVEADAGLRVERLEGAGNEVWHGEHWRVTTLDGTQYWFGTAAASAQDVVVFGDDVGEPCHSTYLFGSYCSMGYRWNLDRVVDARGNTIMYSYTEFRQNYGRYNNAEVSSYALFSVPTGVEYGGNPGAGVGSVARVMLGNEPRCLQEPCYGPENAYKWYDTPWDLNCPLAFTSCPGNTAPTFWWSVRLASVTTQVRGAGGGWVDVDRWELGHYFPGTFDSSSMSLWANGVTRVGLVGGSVATPKVDFVGSRMPNRVDFDEAGGSPPLNKYRITLVANNAGGETTVVYHGTQCTLADLGVYHADNTKRCFPQRWGQGWAWFHKYTVESVTEHDLTGGAPDETWSYAYSTEGSSTAVLWGYAHDEHVGMYEQSWSVWRGYSTVRVTHGVGAGAQEVTESRYYRGLSGDRASFSGATRWVTTGDSQGGGLDDHKALVGRLREVSTLDGASVAASTIHEPTVTQTAFRDRGWDFGDWYAYRVDRTRQRGRVWVAASAGWRWTDTRTSYDGYGLPVDVSDLGDASLTTDDVCTHTDYARDPGAYLIGFVSQTVSTNCAPVPSGADFLAGRQLLYDGSGTVGAAPSRGLVTRANALASVSGTALSWAQATRAGYDVHGRVTASFDALDRLTSTGYTPVVGGPTTGVTVTNPAGHVTSTVVDRHRGVPVSVTDANLKVTDLSYDAVGRLLKVWLPGRSRSLAGNVEYTYLLRSTGANAVTTRRLGPNGNQIVSYRLLDGRLRDRQAQTVAPDGKRVVADTRYDNRGLVAKASLFYNNAAGPSDVLAGFADADVARQTTFTYDRLRRRTNEIVMSLGVEQWRTITGHDGDRAHTTPPAGGTATTTVTDARGRVVALRQYQAPTPTGTYDATLYGYDRLGRRTSVSDPVGNQWSYTFDLRGRQTVAVDPDTGTTTRTFDDAGQVLTVTDGRGVVTANVYDSLGRLTQRRDESVTGPLRASWVFDTLAKGQLTSATRHIGADSYVRAVTGYTDLYRPTGHTVTLPTVEGTLAGDYTFTATYAVDGSPATITHPAAGGLPAETVTTSYADTGLLTTLTGAASYLSGIGYHWDAAITQQTLGSGATRARLTRVYDEATGRLHKAQVHTENPATPNTWDERLTEQYRWYDAGTLKSIVEQANTATVSVQCFTYDHLQRLAEAWTNAAWNCTSVPANVTNRGPDPYWSTWTFDATGSRRTQVRHATSGGADTTTSYDYPAAGATGPHSLTGTTTTGPAGSSTASYNYDTAGNTTSRPGPAAQQTLTWDPEGHLNTLTEATNTHAYLYDPDGQRLITRDPATTTLHLGPMELHRNTTTGSVSATRYHPNAVRTVTGLTWTATDHHQTVQLTIDATTLTPTRRKLLPYGEPRTTAPPTWPDQKGFLGGHADPTGLTHLGARDYDPATGRFLSVDPLIDHTNPQQMHGYTYANNNPTTHADPTGLLVRDFEGGGATPYTPPVQPTPPPVPGTKPGGCIYNRCFQHADAPDIHALAAYVEREAVRRNLTNHTITQAQIYSVILAGCLAAARAEQALCTDFMQNDLNEAAANEAVHAGGIDPIWRWIYDKTGLNQHDIEAFTQAAALAGAISTAGLPGANTRLGGAPTRNRIHCASSFPPGTSVLLADGTTKPIEDLQTGDTVLATDPRTGRTQPQRVTATITTTGPKNLVTITIDTDGTAGNQTATLVATHNHPFWVHGQRTWREAGALEPGQQLLTPIRHTPTIAATTTHTTHTTVHNLTINNTHTYYVLAGNTPVLVHNCPDDIPTGGTSRPSLGDALTNHGKQRLNERGFDDVDIALTRASANAYEQAYGGGTAYVARVGNGFNVIVVGDGGIVTGMKGLTQGEVNNLARNYGWTGYP